MSHSSDFGAAGGGSDEPTRVYPSSAGSYGAQPQPDPNAFPAPGSAPGPAYGSAHQSAGAAGGTYGSGAHYGTNPPTASPSGYGANGYGASGYGTGAPSDYTAAPAAAGPMNAGPVTAGPGQQYGAPAPMQQAPHYYQPQSYPNYVPVPTNTLAIVAMVLSLAGFFSGGVTAVAGIICGHIARRQIQQTGENGDGMALTGLIVGYIIAVPTVLFWIFYILMMVGIVGLGIFGASTS